MWDKNECGRRIIRNLGTDKCPHCVPQPELGRKSLLIRIPKILPPAGRYLNLPCPVLTPMNRPVVSLRFNNQSQTIQSEDHVDPTSIKAYVRQDDGWLPLAGENMQQPFKNRSLRGMFYS